MYSKHLYNVYLLLYHLLASTARFGRARYMDEILLYYDEEGQYTRFERKKVFYLRRDRRNEQRKDAYSNRLVFNRGSMHPRSNSDSKGEDDDDDENLSLMSVSSRRGWQGLLR